MEVTGVYHAYGRRAVLGGVDLRLRPGVLAVLAGIVGENGAGKTTLPRILSGEPAPDRGTVRHYGGFGYCPQAAVLNDALTVRQHRKYFKVAIPPGHGLRGRVLPVVTRAGRHARYPRSAGPARSGARDADLIPTPARTGRSPPVV
ncbi:ATP-binding cassette domain-containing protein, partial [Streptomyces antimycoticus]|uniref:ATP-binding cassette domain-containing protein n=1 Tax=Streptomyces antimycoticus TaxID=68175 RepID=UPI001EEDECCF